MNTIAFFAGLAMGFVLGVLFCDLTEAKTPKRKRKPKRKRLRTDYVVSDDGMSLYRVRCRPGRLDRLLARIEDEECCGE